MSFVHLSHLVSLPSDARLAEVLAHGGDDLRRTHDALSRDFRASAEHVRVTDIAWAVSWSVQPDADAASEPQRKPTGYSKRWGADTPWTEIWRELAARRPDARGASTTLLYELACSVGCEHRQDWRDPAAPPVDRDAANEMFTVLYERHRQRVLGEVLRRFAGRAGNAGAIADEAWARVFQTYWGTSARRRFAGLSRISTLVTQVARFVAADLVRAHREHADIQENDEESEGLVDQLGVLDDQVDRLIASEFRRNVVECARRLPARRRLIVHLVWLHQSRAAEVARLLQISEPAINRHLKLAREAIGRCLRESVAFSEETGLSMPVRPSALTSSAAIRLSGKDE